MVAKTKKTAEKKLTVQEKDFCLQRAKGISAIEAYKICYDTHGVENQALYLRASRLDRQDRIRKEVELSKKPLAKAQAAKEIIASEIWTSAQKNEQLVTLAQEIRQQIYDENQQLIVKNVEVYLKTMELSAKLTAQLTHNVNVKSEAITYHFNLDPVNPANDQVIIEHQAE